MDSKAEDLSSATKPQAETHTGIEAATLDKVHIQSDQRAERDAAIEQTDTKDPDNIQLSADKIAENHTHDLATPPACTKPVKIGALIEEHESSSSNATSNGPLVTTAPSSVTAPTAPIWSSYSSYLKKAVANVESTFDKVLQDSPTTEVNVSRSKSPAAAGRLSMQQRLAMAVGRPSSSGSQKIESPSFKESPISGPNSSVISPRVSLDLTSSAPPTAPSTPGPEPNTNDANFYNETDTKVSTTTGNGLAALELVSLKNIMTSLSDYISSKETSTEPLQELLQSLESQQELIDENSYSTLEKISSLEGKLKYLANSEADRAARAKGSSSGTERKLADKDEQIALLMAEGQALSNKELKHMNTIKKLRANEKEFTKSLDTYFKRAIKAEDEAASLKQKVKTLAKFEKDANQFDRDLSKKDGELEALHKAKSDLETSLNEAQQIIKDLKAKYDEKTMLARDEALTKANTTIDKLTADLTRAQSDKALANELHEQELSQLQKTLGDEIRDYSTRETQMKEELKHLEGKAEYYRSLSEDNSASKGGDERTADNGLLRQIELLQAQHNTASDNWYGIEAKMQSNISTLESEIHELKARETNARKRLKTVSENLKAQNEENEKLADNVSELESIIAQLKNQMAKKDNEISEWKSQLKSITNENEELKSQITQLQQTIETVRAEKSEAVKSAAAATAAAENAAATSTTTFFYPPLPLQEMPYNFPTLKSASPTLRDNAARDSRRSSASISVNQISMSHSIEAIAEEEFTGDDSMLERSASASGLFPVQDTSSRLDNSSVYAASGGASLQLVSKMNTTIRRLESENAATRHELEKLAKAKDEAYAEVVRLMAENEDLGHYREEVDGLNERVGMLEKREKMALEMLGEKSELVDELKADVTDLKEMYREQIENLADQLQVARGS